MHSGVRTLSLGFFSMLALSACEFSSPWGSSSGGTDYGAAVTTTGSGSGTGGTGTGTTTSPKGGVGGEGGTTGSDNEVSASASVASANVAIGTSQTISISFNSADGLSITGFGVSGTLDTLPTGWSAPTNFTCALVQDGSGCVLNLTYAPTAADSGTITVNYVYIDNAGLAKAPGGSITIPYEATAANNIDATASPTGQVNAIVGKGTQSVSVNFATDTGFAATNFAVTNLSSLPAGWTSTPSALTCAIVTSGSGCQTVLTFTPAGMSRGTVSLTYSYNDASGAAKTGTINIPYATTGGNNIVATWSPTGQVNAIEKTGGQAVAVTFNTDDGNAASNLMITSGLTALPTGWSSGSKSFTCGSISTGNGCQLPLTYAPTALGSGTVKLTYAYTNSAGTAETGTLDIPYAATTNDNIVATPSPSGQITAVVGMLPQTVAVTFTTDDARQATELAVTTDLTMLPAGWSASNSSFSCLGVTSGTGCQLMLSYTPTAYTVPGTLTLRYSYKNNGNETKTGSLNIPYRATTNDAIVGTPSSTSLAVLTGSSNPVTVVFATNDGNPASAFSITSGLSTLPSGWSSSASTLSCATVSAGTACQLGLTFAPTEVGSGTVTLGYSYMNDAGLPLTGTVSIAYRANADDMIVATPSIPTLNVAVASINTVTITFDTNDGNLASALSVTSDLTALLTGWTSSLNSFSCSSVSTGSSCTLTLQYLPLLPASGTLMLNYGYTNNAGTVEVGTVSINYTAT